VIGDITTSAERGSLVGIFGGGKSTEPLFDIQSLRIQVRMLGQGIGPVIGGILSEYLGFRSIFWALVILSGISLFSILLFLPETLRTVAGNGSVRLHGHSKPFIYYLVGQKDTQEDAVPEKKKSRVSFRTILSPLRFLTEKDVFITLFFGSIVYTVWSMVTSSTSALFQSIYGLSTLQIGLTFLGNGKHICLI